LRFAGFIRYAGKSFAIFHSPPSYIHCANDSFRENSREEREAFVETLVAVFYSWKTLRNGQEYIKYDWDIYRHVCADFTLSKMTMQSQEEKSCS